MPYVYRLVQRSHPNSETCLVPRVDGGQGLIALDGVSGLCRNDKPDRRIDVVVHGVSATAHFHDGHADATWGDSLHDAASG